MLWFFYHVSEERTASIFRVTELGQVNNPFMCPEDGYITLLRNVGTNESSIRFEKPKRRLAQDNDVVRSMKLTCKIVIPVTFDSHGVSQRNKTQGLHNTGHNLYSCAK